MGSMHMLMSSRMNLNPAGFKIESVTRGESQESQALCELVF